MSTQLLSIYAAIEALQVSDGYGIVPCYNLDELPRAIEAASTPVRLLLPFDDNDTPADMIALGQTIGATWSVYDLCLMAPVESGRGPVDVAQKLAVYAANYADAIRQQRNLGLSNIWVDQIAIRRGVYQYPANSGAMFYGVMVRLEVHEIMS